ncbi:MAG: hypothetical protein QOH57_3626, partial [Mycobacterium sp.]|nr:hypothetical protein [Mycobacterium sp.]
MLSAHTVLLMAPSRRDALILAAILMLAAALRVIGLPGRGTWDDDQGYALLEMLQWVRGGQMPLIGPVSSIGTAHHGVGFYWILAPSAFLTDANPVAAAATLVVVGVGGVAATWWLGRTVRGPLAGHVAAVAMAVSPSAISASTFVWNSNIVGPAAALATAAGWHAWRTCQARWWFVAAVGTLFMLQGHLLAAVALPPLVALLFADLWRRPRPDRPKMLLPVAGFAAIIAAGYVPLLIYELRNGFSETVAVGKYLAEPGMVGGPPLILRPLIVLWRIEVWPVAGPVPSAVLGGLPAATLVIVALFVAATGKPHLSRTFGRWAVGSLAWAVLALTIVAPGLAIFTAGLPNDQYHAWLDPMVFAGIGVAANRLAEDLRAPIGKTLAATLAVCCVALSILELPTLTSPDGGWPRAEQSAARIRSKVDGQSMAVVGVAKSGAALAFPLTRAGPP